MGRKSRDKEFIEMLLKKFPWVDKIEPFTTTGRWQNVIILFVSGELSKISKALDRLEKLSRKIKDLKFNF